MTDREEIAGVLSAQDVERIAKELDNETGTVYDWAEFPTKYWLDAESNKVVSNPDRDWIAEVDTMLKEDGKARSVLAALSFPIRMANLTLEKPEGDQGQTEWLEKTFMATRHEGGMETPLKLIIAQMARAAAYKRQYFEKVYTKLPDGKIGYKKIMWRPPASCELLRNKESGNLEGFRQWVGIELAGADHEGYVKIPARRTFVFLNNAEADPYYGDSDMAVTHWAWDLKRKIVALWHFHLEGEAMNRILAYGKSITEANDRARGISKLKSSGVLPIVRKDDNEKVFDTLDGSGESGRLTFRDVISYLDQCMSNSILAGWLDLTGHAASGKGSYALSADQSGLFISSRHAAACSIADAITCELIAPLVRINFGPDAAVPELKIEKIDDHQADQVFTMLNAFGIAQTLQVPEEFLHLLIERVGQYLDLPDHEVRTLIEEEKERLDKKREQADAAAAMQIAGMDPANQPEAAQSGGTRNGTQKGVSAPGGTPSGQQGQPGARKADPSRQDPKDMTKTVQAATNVVKRVNRSNTKPTNSAPIAGVKKS